MVAFVSFVLQRTVALSCNLFKYNRDNDLQHFESLFEIIRTEMNTEQ